MQPPSNTNAPFINSLKQAEVRWLANAIFAPPLLQMRSLPDSNTQTIARAPNFKNKDHLQAAVFILDTNYRQWLQTLDNNPQLLLAFLRSERRLKLGILHERLWQFFLGNQSSTQLLATNLKAKQGRRDIGEFDIVYQHQDHGLIHLEVASKYYLASTAATDQWQVWLGPGKTDRLDLKLDHSINKQINLADCSGVKEQLITKLYSVEDSAATDTRQYPFTLGKQLHIGGRLFYRYSLIRVTEAINAASDLFERRLAPSHLNDQHLCGHWLFAAEWQQLKSRLVSDYQWLEKSQWLDTSEHNLKRDSQTPASIQADDIEHTQTPRLLVYSTHRQQKYFCFIVPDNWEENAFQN